MKIKKIEENIYEISPSTLMSRVSGKIEKFEKTLKRKTHIIIEPSLKKLTKELKLEIINGLVLYGYLENE